MGSELGTDRTIADRSGLIVDAEQIGDPLDDVRVGSGMSVQGSRCI
jgi:hypothetical protein